MTFGAPGENLRGLHCDEHLALVAGLRAGVEQAHHPVSPDFAARGDKVEGGTEPGAKLVGERASDRHVVAPGREGSEAAGDEVSGNRGDHGLPLRLDPGDGDGGLLPGVTHERLGAQGRRDTPRHPGFKRRARGSRIADSAAIVDGPETEVSAAANANSAGCGAGVRISSVIST